MARRDNSQSDTAYTRAARPVWAFIETIEREAQSGEQRMVEAAATLLDRFENQARRGGAPDATLKPARYALALLIDRRARQLQRLRLSTWSVLSGQQLFEGREISQERVQEFRDTARQQGRDFDALERFLGDVMTRIENLRKGPQRRRSGNWGAWIAATLVVFLVAIGAYACFIEYRFQTRLSAELETEILEIGLDRDPEGADLVARLDQLADAKARLSRAVQKAPFKRAIRLPWVDSETRAERHYNREVSSRVPRAVGDAIEQAIATEGEGLALYDALRAWAVLSGDNDWQRAYVVGWLEDYEGALSLDGLSRHALALTGPDTELLARDPVLMDQARRFTAEAEEPDLAWLELLRAEETRALPLWRPDEQVPGLEDVVLRRSGKPVSTAMLGLFTQAGWTHAREFGIGLAVQRARNVAPSVTGKPLAPVNASPDLVLDRLHDNTIAAWKNLLTDLRVRPFVKRQTAIEVSGKLSLPDNPISQLLGKVWVESGGADRGRSHEQQLRLAREFGAMIQYVEQGRMAEISRLFSTLNVALGSIDLDAERGSQRLMTWQDTARSIQALKAAPLIVVQIAEDVLAQSSAAQTEDGSNPLTRQWQQLVYPACREVLEGRYPFGDGADANFNAVASLLAPNGQLILFARATALPLLETETSPWRWKPEARFAGLKPESAVFFERSFAVSDALFGSTGQIGLDLTLAALAERGETVFAIGGVGAPVRASGEPAMLSWPGPEPEKGLEVAFRDGTESARILHDGAWGLMRLMDGLRLRLRDKGERVLLDLRTASGRIFLEMGFDRPINPVSARSHIRGFSCPAAL
jgi:type VI protein secretion system component VasK